MDDPNVKYLISVAGALILTIWGMLRHESRKTEEALEKKASIEALNEAKKMAVDALNEAKANHLVAMRDVKDHFQRIIDRNHEDYQARVRDLNERQDREINWLKDELSTLGENLQQMRQEQSAATTQQLAHNAAIMQSIQQLQMIIQSRGH